MKRQQRRPAMGDSIEPGTTAEIRFDQVRLLTPAGSPYERELALEHVEHSARRHGSARIVLGGVVWLVNFDPQRRLLVWARRREKHAPARHLRLAVPA